MGELQNKNSLKVEKGIDSHSEWVYYRRGLRNQSQQRGGDNVSDNYIKDNLKFLRERKGLTQTAVSKALKVKTSTYNAWETGQNIPRDEMKVKIAEFYGLSVGYIFFKPIAH